MGLQPRKEPKLPSDIFIDRNDPRETFKIELDKVSAEPDQCHLLFFYGVGGVGKSVLLKRIEKELKDDDIPDSIIGKREDVVAIRYDLKNNCRSIDVINSLSSALKEQGIMLSRISVAREMLLKYGIQPDKKERISDNTFWKIVSGVFKIPYSSLIGMAADTGYKKLKEWSVKSKDYSIPEDFKAIRNMDAETLMENYAWCFKRDLRYAIKALREDKKSLVFLIDTYETISDSAPGETGYADRWLEDIVLSEWTTGMLWCMAGRDLLSWSVLENERGIQFEMEEFEPEDACLYLENRAGIRKNELKAFLIKLTHCLPVYLDLCAVEFSGFSPQKKRELNTFHFTEEEYQEIFGRDREELIIRSCQSISDETRDLANELSVFGVWTREMAKELIHNFSDTRYEAFVRHSFIDKDEGSGLRTYHEVIRKTFEHAFQKEHPEAYKEAFLKFVNYCILHPDSPVITQKTVNRLIHCYENGLLEPQYQKELAEMLLSVIGEKAGSVHERYDWNKRIFRSTPETEEKYLKIVNSYLESCQNAGHYQEMHEVALKISQKHQFGNDSDSFEFLNLSAISFSNLGQYAESLELFKLCYEKRKACLGETHPDTLGSLHNLALAYSNTGDYAKSLELNRLCYEKSKACLGENHPDTLRSLQNLALAYSKTGDYAKSLELKQLCYEKRKEILGETHPDTLRSLQNLAIDYATTGDYAKSLELSKHCYEKMKEILGENHPDTLSSLNGLALAYSNTGDYAKSLELNRLCYEKRKACLGETHPDTLGSLHNLALAYSNTGDYEKSLELDKRCYEKMKENLGENHPDTLRSLSNLAAGYSKTGDYEKSLELKQRCYEKNKEILGENHPDTLLSLHNLAVAYSNTGDCAKSLELNRLCYEKRKACLGENHPDTLRSLSNLAAGYSKTGDYEKSLKLFKLCYEKMKACLGENHPDTLRSLQNLAIDDATTGDYAKSLELDKLCYEKMKACLGENHPDTLRSLHNLAVDYANTGDYAKSLELAKICYEKRKACLGENHPDTLGSLHNLAVAYSKNGDYEKSLELFKLCYDKRKEILGENHPDTISVKSMVDALMERIKGIPNG